MIIVTYVDLEDGELAGHQPSVIVVDEDNHPVEAA